MTDIHQRESDGVPGLLRATNRRERRMAVVIAIGGYAASVITVWLLERFNASSWWLALPIAVEVITLIAIFRICYNDADSWHVANARDDQLDERQLRVRNRATVWSYRIVAAGAGLAAIYGVTAHEQGYWFPTGSGQLQAIMWAVLLGTLILPAGFVAWTEPDFPYVFDI
jgi:hypothetical protein